MVKINILLLVITLGFFITTSFKQKCICANDNARIFNKQKKDSVSKQTNDYLSCTYLDGTWNYIFNNDHQDFSISLIVNDATITGKHCFVYGEFGDKIDCPDENSINAIWDGNKIKGKIISDWATDSISIELKLISKDSLCLIPFSDAGQSFFQTKMLFVKKKE